MVLAVSKKASEAQTTGPAFQRFVHTGFCGPRGSNNASEPQTTSPALQRFGALSQAACGGAKKRQRGPNRVLWSSLAQKRHRRPKQQVQHCSVLVPCRTQRLDRIYALSHASFGQNIQDEVATFATARTAAASNSSNNNQQL